MNQTDIRFLRLAALAMLLVYLAGCVTSMTVERAEGYNYTVETPNGTNTSGTNTVTVIQKQPEPGFYALVPLAVTADMALIPGYVLFTLFGWGELAFTGKLPY